MNEQAAKLERREARERGELVTPIRTRISRGEVEMMMQLQREEIAQLLNEYHRDMLLPVVNRVYARAAAYLPWYRRLLNWLLLKLGRR